MRKKKQKKDRRVVGPTQREVLRDVMLSASECDTWLTLQELALLTHYGEASISAQLRHLRKPRHGAFVVKKRRRESDEIVREEIGVVWEYRLGQGVPIYARRLPGIRAAQSVEAQTISL